MSPLPPNLICKFDYPRKSLVDNNQKHSIIVRGLLDWAPGLGVEFRAMPFFLLDHDLKCTVENIETLLFDGNGLHTPLKTQVLMENFYGSRPVGLYPGYQSLKKKEKEERKGAFFSFFFFFFFFWGSGTQGSGARNICCCILSCSLILPFCYWSFRSSVTKLKFHCSVVLCFVCFNSGNATQPLFQTIPNGLHMLCYFQLLMTTTSALLPCKQWLRSGIAESAVWPHVTWWVFAHLCSPDYFSKIKNLKQFISHLFHPNIWCLDF